MKKVQGYISENKSVEIKEGIFLMDGYIIAESLLEGIDFEVCVKDEKIKYIRIYNKNHEDYFEQFNRDLFFSKMKDYVEKRILPNGDCVELPVAIVKKYNLISNEGFYG